MKLYLRLFLIGAMNMIFLAVLMSPPNNGFGSMIWKKLLHAFILFWENRIVSHESCKKALELHRMHQWITADIGFHIHYVHFCFCNRKWQKDIFVNGEMHRG